MTAVATVEDIIRTLDSDATLLEALRARLLTRELLALPQTVASLAASQSELREEVSRLAAAQIGFAATQAAMQKDIARLFASQAELSASQAAMQKDIVRLFATQAELAATQAAMRKDIARLFASQAEIAATQAELSASQAAMQKDIARLFATQAELAATQAELREEVSRLVATQEAMQKDIARIFASQAHMWEEVSRIVNTLEDFMRSTNRRFDILSDDVAFMKGDRLEMRLQKKVQAMLGQRKRLRGIRVINATFPAGLSPEFGDAIDKAADEGIITEDQRGRILSTDLIALARRQYSQEPVYVSFEAAFSLNADDTRRVLATGAALALVFPEAEIMNFIYGRSISGRDRTQAESEGVDVVLDRSER